MVWRRKRETRGVGEEEASPQETKQKNNKNMSLEFGHSISAAKDSYAENADLVLTRTFQGPGA